MSDRKYEDLTRLIVHAVNNPVVSDPHAPLLPLPGSPHLDSAAGSWVGGEVVYGPSNALVKVLGEPDYAFASFPLEDDFITHLAS